MSTQDLGPRLVSGEPDPYLPWDAAYVLGALSPAERREYEQHLSGCPTCQRAVSEIAGMPGLLAQASPEDAAMLTGSVEQLPEDPPPDFRPTLHAHVRRRRRRVWLALGSIAAALVLIIGGLGALQSLGILGTPASYRVPFTSVTPNGITAVADISPGRADTKIDVECQYAISTGAAPGDAYGEYAVWVRDRAGNETEIKSWYAKPNKVMHPSGTAPIGTWRLAQVEIRDAHSNEILLTAPIH